MKVEEFNLITEDLKKRKLPSAVKLVVTIMLDKKAEDIVVLKLKGINDITDYMILCTGNAARQNSAVADEIEHKLRKDFRLKTYSVEGQKEGEWILLDYIDFVVHIFSPESRQKYALEKLWMDAKRYNFYVAQES